MAGRYGPNAKTSNFRPPNLLEAVASCSVRRMHVLGAGQTDVGKRRSHNEDRVAVRPDLGLYLVCDGMGGHAAGEVAAELAVATVVRHLEAHHDTINAFDDTMAARDALIRIVDEAITHASSAVFGAAQQQHDGGDGSERKSGMGTTLTMLVCTKTVGVMGHVGDTRLYLRRHGTLHQLSEDHTYVNEMVRRGLAKLDELKDGPYANVITRAVGIDASVRVDTVCFDLLPGDTLLLCSDGLSKHIDDPQELGRLLDNDHIPSIPSQLIDIANARGGSDNVSAIVVRAVPEPGDTAFELHRTTEVNLKIETLRDILLFQYLDMGELCKVINIARAHTFTPKQTIFIEGDAGDCFYAVLDGGVDVTRQGRHVCRLDAGHHFGEMALFNSRPRSATITARPERGARVLIIDRSRFNDLLKREQTLAVKLLWAFSQVLSLRLDDTSALLYGHVPHKSADTDVNRPFDLPRLTPTTVPLPIALPGAGPTKTNAIAADTDPHVAAPATLNDAAALKPQKDNA